MLAIVAVLTLAILVFYNKWRRNYWKRRNVLQLESTHWFFGNSKDLLLNKRHMWDVVRENYDYFKSNQVKYGGLYSPVENILFVIDPQLSKTILIKDFDSFMNHGMYFNEKTDPLSANLFMLEGPKWRALRQKLTPTFTSGKIKMMYHTMMTCASVLSDVMKNISISDEPVEMRDVLARFTTDIIGSCAFGIDCNSLKDPNSDFRVYGRRSAEPTLSFTQLTKMLLMMLLPNAVITAIGLKGMDQDVEDFFVNVVKSNIDYREKNNVIRKDFLQLLLQLKNQGQVKEDGDLSVKITQQSAMTFMELAAQCFVFFIGGFGTSSDVMTHALYELSLNQDVQVKIRKSINEGLAKYNNEMSYEAIQEITDLENVVNETMRKYPIAPVLPRRCTKTYKVPESDLIIEKGTKVWVPVTGYHYDSEFYPNPEKFNPDRFYENNPDYRPDVLFLPFGDGPRQCIGLRFGLLQSKLGLATILKDYKFSLNDKSDIGKKLLYLNISKA
ncbi:cytochrome P450 6A1-like [Cylas formicarius]|uniref:cytochrome P450 6A1-like n=1 Tax=Cylas formicarius TaxID=197179 RepID=UPI00295857CC|nr:cytochrome P450 6A1-like [Cylas formicarius]